MSKIRKEKREKELQKKRTLRANKPISQRYKYVINLMYDGYDYGGYAKQKHGNTIQNKLEKALESVFKKQIHTTESSRTDAKVHALDQMVMFELDFEINTEKVKNQLNDILMPDIYLKSLVMVKLDFHVRYDVISKTYEYAIMKNYDPRMKHSALCLYKKLNVQAMQDASKLLIGKHDFITYCSAKATSQTTIRTLYNIEIVESEQFIKFIFQADGFLYNMIRLLMNVLIQVGLEKQEISYPKDLLDAKYKPANLASVPAHGLCLMEINYKKTL